MNRELLKKRTKEFALRAINLVDSLPRCTSGDVLGKQLLRSATSVGANYRSACRGRSEAEFVAKLGVVIEEADESEYWVELIADSGLMKKTACRTAAERSIRTRCHFYRFRPNHPHQIAGTGQEEPIAVNVTNEVSRPPRPLSNQESRI